MVGRKRERGKINREGGLVASPVGCVFGVGNGRMVGHDPDAGSII
jgi:hypothetical protein